MKKYSILLLIIISCNSNRINYNKESVSISKKTLLNIDRLIEYKRRELSIQVYENDIIYMKNLYGIKISKIEKIVKNKQELIDVSDSKLIYDKCLLIAFREKKEDFEYKDTLGDSIVQKWNRIDYTQIYHFDNTTHNPTLSLLKMFDFYNSIDLKKYSDSLKIETVKRYKSGKYPDLNYCIDNPEYYLDSE